MRYGSTDVPGGGRQFVAGGGTAGEPEHENSESGQAKRHGDSGGL